MPIPSCIPYIPGEAPGTIILWTRQAIPVALQLEQTGSYTVTLLSGLTRSELAQ